MIEALQSVLNSRERELVFKLKEDRHGSLKSFNSIQFELDPKYNIPFKSTVYNFDRLASEIELLKKLIKDFGGHDEYDKHPE